MIQVPSNFQPQSASIFSCRSLSITINLIVVTAAFILLIVGLTDTKLGEKYYTNYSFVGGDSTPFATFYFCYGALGAFGAYGYNQSLIKSHFNLTLILIVIRLISNVVRIYHKIQLYPVSLIYLAQELVVSMVSLPILFKSVN